MVSRASTVASGGNGNLSNAEVGCIERRPRALRTESVVWPEELGAFQGVYEIEGTIKQGLAFPQTLEIDGITRGSVDDRLGYDRWAVEGEMSLTFRAAGFRQIIRHEPLHVPRQTLALDERHGLSFSEDSFDGAPSSLAVTHALSPPAVQRIRRSGAAPAE
jgi:hypothetical protein